jgi:hypothetical protein
VVKLPPKAAVVSRRSKPARARRPADFVMARLGRKLGPRKTASTKLAMVLAAASAVPTMH